MRVKSGSAKGIEDYRSFDTSAAEFILDGETVNLNEYFDKWAKEAAERRNNQFGSTTAEEGVHELEFTEERVFERGRATFNGKEFDRMEMSGTIQVHVSKAVVVSAFEVESRGRAISVQVNLHSGANIMADFVDFLV